MKEVLKEIDYLVRYTGLSKEDILAGIPINGHDVCWMCCNTTGVPECLMDGMWKIVKDDTSTYLDSIFVEVDDGLGHEIMPYSTKDEKRWRNIVCEKVISNLTIYRASIIIRSGVSVCKDFHTLEEVEALFRDPVAFANDPIAEGCYYYEESL